MKIVAMVFNKEGKQLLGNGYGQGIFNDYKTIKGFERFVLNNSNHTLNNTLKAGYKIKLENDNGTLLKEFN